MCLIYIFIYISVLAELQQTQTVEVESLAQELKLTKNTLKTR